jgi:hypothetical protein
MLKVSHFQSKPVKIILATQVVKVSNEEHPDKKMEHLFVFFKNNDYHERQIRKVIHEVVEDRTINKEMSIWMDQESLYPISKAQLRYHKGYTT